MQNDDIRVSVLMETWNGRLVMVPEEKMEDFKKRQERLREELKKSQKPEQDS